MNIGNEQRALLLDRIQGSLLGVAIGDAMGVPVEVMTAEEIQALNDGLGIVGYQAVMRQSRVAHAQAAQAQQQVLQKIEPETSDDTQKSVVVGESLVRKGCFDAEDMARGHVQALNKTIAGWGGTSVDSTMELKQYFDSNHQYGRHPETPAGGDGHGNAPGMKISMLACFYALKRIILDLKNPIPEKLLIDSIRLGRLTHGDLRASHAGLAVSAIIFSIVDDRRIFDFPDDLLLKSIRDVKMAEQLFPAKTKPLISEVLQKLNDKKLLADPIAIRKTIGTDGKCWESIPFAIATFMRHPLDFKAGILEAINAGGDTDSNAAIVGSIIGANVGLKGIPQEWRNYLPEEPKLLQLCEQLLEVGLSS